MAFIDSSELGHCPTARLLIENEVPSRIAAKDGSAFNFSRRSRGLCGDPSWLDQHWQASHHAIRQR